MVTIHELVEKLKPERVSRNYFGDIMLPCVTYNKHFFYWLCVDTLYRPARSIRPESFAGMVSDYEYLEMMQRYAEQINQVAERFHKYIK